MDPTVLSHLRARAPQIQARWDALLRIERVNTPLATPDALVFLIPGSLDEILQVAATVDSSYPLALARQLARPACVCGRNPYLAYFIAAEQALVEALVLTQAELPACPTRDADLAALYFAVRTIAAREMEAFCGLCTHRFEAGAQGEKPLVGDETAGPAR